MAIKVKPILKYVFRNLAKPTENDFGDLIDSTQQPLIPGNGIQLTDNGDGTTYIQISENITSRYVYETRSTNFTAFPSYDYEIVNTSNVTITFVGTTFDNGASCNIYATGTTNVSFIGSGISIQYEEEYPDTPPIVSKNLMYCVHRIGNRILINRAYYG